MSDHLPAPGWYPAPHANNDQRYWDGVQWLEPAAAAPAAPTALIAEPGATGTPQRKLSSRSKVLIIAGSVVAATILIAGIGSAVSGGKPNEPVADVRPTSAATVEPADEVEEEPPAPIMVSVPEVVGMTASDAYNAMTAAGLTPPAMSSFADPAAIVLSTAPVAGTQAEEGSDVTFTLEEKPKLTLGQENAISKAQSYLSLMGFSRTGLIEQLQFEGFSPEEATFGADSAGADWNAECAEKAQSYIDMMSFSRQGLYDQLAFEGFQASEIEFGLAAVGY